MRPLFGPPEVRVFRLFSRWRAGCAIWILQQDRWLVADGPVRPILIIVFGQSSNFSRASASVRNQWAFRHSARNRPLKASLNALSVGFPGREKSA
jgi:hypothetical protein